VTDILVSILSNLHNTGLPTILHDVSLSIVFWVGFKVRGGCGYLRQLSTFSSKLTLTRLVKRRHRNDFYAREHSVLAMVILFWCLSQPGTDRSPGEIETSGFYHNMIA